MRALPASEGIASSATSAMIPSNAIRANIVVLRIRFGESGGETVFSIAVDYNPVRPAN
jgi:hypothetical protein